MVTITKETIIGDILDIAPQTAPLFNGDRHALSGLSGFSRRNCRRSLHGAWYRYGRTAGRTEQADRSRRCTVNWFYEIAPRVTLPQQWWFSGGAIFVFGAV